MSPRWGFRGFGLPMFYKHVVPLGLRRRDLSPAIHIALLWSAGGRQIAFYRHIAPLERNEPMNLYTSFSPPLRFCVFASLR